MIDNNESFRNYIEEELDSFLQEQQKMLSLENDSLKIDLHCHDKNSDKPSERLGRILGIPETWLKTDDLLSCLETQKTSALTITNHNNARSCWDLLDRGFDILPAAEFTCTLPESGFSIHVLTYGFSPFHEAKLNSMRSNLYRFLSFCTENDILTVWAHPLYFNRNNFSPRAVENLEHIATLFSHFEVINGQRNSWQNLITVNWLKSFNKEKIDRITLKNGVNVHNLCSNPYSTIMVGGSDDHMGLFAGSSGTFVKVHNLSERLKDSSKSDLVLEGLKQGLVAPYGFYTEENKMSISFLELFYMIVKNMEDPGLVRMMTHQGTRNEKLLGFIITNGIGELRRHKFTMQFLKTFHKAIQGKEPDFWTQTFVKKSTRPLLSEIENIARSRKKGTDVYVKETKDSLRSLFTQLSRQAIFKGVGNLKELNKDKKIEQLKLQDLLEKIELPANLRTIFGEDFGVVNDHNSMKDKSINVGGLFDRLSFPLLASSIIGLVNFTSTLVLHDNRHFLDHFARENGMKTPPKRMLWLTDTFDDKNGIAISLKNYHDEICKKNLPIDILVCHESLESSNHLIVSKPLGSFPIPLYREQSIRIPDIMDIHEIFKEGNYDRVICSTELLMGGVGLYLKKCFNVEAYFFLHTDWLEFALKTLELSGQVRTRLTRFLRMFYRNFDKLITLNSDHAAWLTGPKMNISPEKVTTTKHWLNSEFSSGDKIGGHKYIQKNKDEKILLFVGRISKEKGISDFPEIYKIISEKCGPCKVVFVGRGPAKEELSSLMPEAVFIDWVEQNELASLYSMGDFLIFPSRFDTFGRVVLEALSCGCPVAAYSEKGPADILVDGVSGVLRSCRVELALEVSRILNDEHLHLRMRREALKRSEAFNSDNIIEYFLEQTGLKEEPLVVVEAPGGAL